MGNRARNCVTPIPIIHPVGIPDRVSFVFLVVAVVSLFGVVFFGLCSRRGGGFFVCCWFFRFFFELAPRDSRWGPDAKWGHKVINAKPPTGTCRRGRVGDIVARIVR